MKYLMLLFILAGCEEASSSTKYEASCVGIAHRLFRCENIEAICYMHWGAGGVSCFLKETAK